MIWSRPVSPFIVGMFHDLCKVDSYEWIPDSIDCSTLGGQQSVTDEVHAYAYKKEYPAQRTWGQINHAVIHYYATDNGRSSLYPLSHGGIYYKEEWADYSRAVAQFPNVLWTHQADMIASQLRGI